MAYEVEHATWSWERMPSSGRGHRSLCSHADQIREQGVTSLAIFGFRARGEEHPNSDLDVLIGYDARPPFRLYDLIRVQRLHEELTGSDVHASTSHGFPSQQLDRLLKDAVSLL